MQIACPYCGARDAQEFAYLGDATLKRPDPSAADVEKRTGAVPKKYKDFRELQTKLDDIAGPKSQACQ